MRCKPHWLCTAVLGLSAATAPAVEPPTPAELQAKVQEFMQWYQSTGEDAQDVAKRAAKLEEILSDVNFDELDMTGLEILQRYARFSVSVSKKLNDRRAALLRDDPGVDGAAAAALAIRGAFGDSAKMKEALLATLNHPAFDEAIRKGRISNAFGILSYVPDEVLEQLKDEIIGLAKYFTEDASVDLLAHAGVSYIIAINKMHEYVNAETREAIRAAVHDNMLAAAETADPRMKSGLMRSASFLESKFARGLLLGHEAPELHFTWIKGGPAVAALSDLKGKVVVLDFWATWCFPCIASFPNIRGFQARYDGYEVVIVGVTSPQGYHITPAPDRQHIDTANDVEKEYELMDGYLSQQDMTWMVAFSEEEVYNADYGVRGIPHMTIIDADGIVRYNWLHPAGSSLEEKSKKIDKLLKEAGLETPPPVESEANSGD